MRTRTERRDAKPRSSQRLEYAAKTLRNALEQPMIDRRKKLEALRQQLGLKTGAEVGQERKTAPAVSPRDAAEGNTAAARTGPGARETLRDLTERLGMLSASEWVEKREEIEAQRAAGDFEIEKVVPGTVIEREEGAFFLLRRDYPLGHLQGIVELGAALQSSSKHIAFSAADPALEDFDPRRALFMDTETTGLAGGTGTVAFLVGVGYFTEEDFRLEQCFLRDFDEEEAMLSYLGERFGDFDTVVGYNSKSFDLPLLRTRFIQNRLPFRLDRALHYDLVHAARRFWKRRLSDCSLGNIEREVLGIYRHGDVPGYLIPQLWLDYLDTRDARPLEGVFYHHQMDILSLAALTGWLSQCLDAEDGEGFAHIEDQLSVVRMHFTQKHYAEAVRCGRAYLEKDAASPMRRECLEMVALAHKRLNEFEEMEEIFETLLSEFPGDAGARLELAKHHEHRTRDLRRAEHLCREAVEQLRQAGLGGVSGAGLYAFERRLERIRKKLARGGGEA